MGKMDERQQVVIVPGNDDHPGHHWWDLATGLCVVLVGVVAAEIIRRFVQKIKPSKTGKAGKGLPDAKSHKSPSKKKKKK